MATERRVGVLLGRREFLKALGLLATALAAPITLAERSWAAARGRFFTTRERRTLAALVDTILPPDTDPGASALGVPRYVEWLLTAFDHRVPRLFAGGPFSGRNPYVDFTSGTPTRRRPPDGFRAFIEPTRLQALYWRAALYGSAHVPEVAALDAQLGGSLPGLRNVYRDGLAALDTLARQLAGAAFADLAAADQVVVRDAIDTRADLFPRYGRHEDRTFLGIVVGHTIEGAFAAPEYGGNRHGRGWAMLGIEGDSQPLGYALYSRRDDAYHERTGHPLSGPNPDEAAAPRPLSAEAQAFQNAIVAATAFASDGSC